ncbi:hypothetical protein [Neisseria sp. CCUG12390]|uniref:hypothetical protein n=1 Tax=Neisseria sp. CCUG12390 TaxID=3392035 RepID=UPI003A0FDE56
MNQLVFISDKAEVAAPFSDLQNFDKVCQILTEKFGFKIRKNRQGIFDFFYHSDFKENVMEYGGGELRVKNPTDAFLERMIEIAHAFPSAKVVSNDGGQYLDNKDMLYPAISLEDGAQPDPYEAVLQRMWPSLKVGMVVSALFFLAAVLDKFVF